MKITSVFPPAGRNLSQMLLAGFIFLLLSAAGAAQADTADGKKLFLKQKCNKCHTVNTEGIAKAEEADDDEEEEEETDDEPPDLSGVGERFDAEKMDGWLRKKIAIDGDKHPKRMKATDDERKAIIGWLLQAKPDPNAKKPAAKK